MLWSPVFVSRRTLSLAILVLAGCATSAPTGGTLAPRGPLPTASSGSAAPATWNPSRAASAGRLESAAPSSSGRLEPALPPVLAQDTTPIDSGPVQGMAYENAFEKDRLLMYRLEVGLRRYDGSWDPIDQPLVFGAGITYEPAYWPIGIEAGVSYSSTDDSKDGSGYRSTNLEFTFGGSKSFWPVRDKLIWTFGAGIALTKTRDRVDVFVPPAGTQRTSADDWWTALYLHSRLGWKLSEVFDIGLDLRGMSGQNVNTVGGVRSSDNAQLMLSFGFHM